MSEKRILTGIKPTGAPHIGNYVGALRPAIDLASQTSNGFLFIADYHALNSVRDVEKLRQNNYSIAATWLALGLNPEKTTFYRQSSVPEIFELATILMAITPKGLMNRAHAYKASIDKNRELGKEGSDIDDGINMGLYTYPILMAADILIMDSEIIPVGKDQIQHVEMTRDIARSFNHLFGETLVLPEYKVQEYGANIPGLDGRKMSKSYGNTIPLFETSKRRRKMVMKIVTDSKLPEDKKDPDESTIYHLYANFANADDLAQMAEDFKKGGLGYGDAKQRLFEAMDKALAEETEKYNDLMARPQDINDILKEGTDKARKVAQETIKRIRSAIGS